MGRTDLKRKGLALLLAVATTFSNVPMNTWAAEVNVESSTEDSSEGQEIFIDQQSVESQSKATSDSSQEEKSDKAEDSAVNGSESAENSTEKKFEGVILFDISNGGQLKLSGGEGTLELRKEEQPKEVSFTSENKVTIELVADEGYDLKSYVWKVDDKDKSVIEKRDFVEAEDKNYFKKEFSPKDKKTIFEVEFVAEDNTKFEENTTEKTTENTTEKTTENTTEAGQSEEVIVGGENQTEAKEETKEEVVENPDGASSEEVIEEGTLEPSETTPDSDVVDNSDNAVFDEETEAETEPVTENTTEAVGTEAAETEAVETEAVETEAEETEAEVTETELVEETESETEVTAPEETILSDKEDDNLFAVVLNNYTVFLERLDCRLSYTYDNGVLTLIATPIDPDKVVYFLPKSDFPYYDIVEDDEKDYTFNGAAGALSDPYYVDGTYRMEINEAALNSDAYIIAFAAEETEINSVDDLNELYLTEGQVTGSGITAKNHIVRKGRYIVPEGWVSNQYDSQNGGIGYYGTSRWTLSSGSIKYTSPTGGDADFSTREKRFFCMEPRSGDPGDNAGTVVYFTNSTNRDARALELLAYLLELWDDADGHPITILTNNGPVYFDLKGKLDAVGACAGYTDSTTKTKQKITGNLVCYGFATHMIASYLYHEWKGKRTFDWVAASNTHYEDLNATGKNAIKGIANDLYAVVDAIDGDVFKAAMSTSHLDAELDKSANPLASVTPAFRFDTNVQENTLSLTLPANVTVHRASDGAQLDPSSIPGGTDIYLRKKEKNKGGTTETVGCSALNFTEGCAYFRKATGQDLLGVAVLSTAPMSLTVTWPPFTEYVKVKKKSGNTTLTHGNHMYSLNGAQFKFIDCPAENFISGGDTFTISGDGMSTDYAESSVLEVVCGTYTLAETRLPDRGYIASPGLPTSVVLDGTYDTPENPRVIEITDPPQYYNVVGLLQKLQNYNNRKSKTSMANAQYRVDYYDNLYCTGTPFHTWTFKTIQDTDYSARFGLQQAYWVGGDPMVYGDNVLPLGSYKITEVKPPAGFDIDPSAVRTNGIPAVNSNDQTFVEEFNKPGNRYWEPEKYARIQIRKNSKDQNDPNNGHPQTDHPDGDATFAGAVFEVYMWDDRTNDLGHGITRNRINTPFDEGSVVKAESGEAKEYKKGDLIGEIVTDANGIGLSTFAVGTDCTYKIVEKTPPAGYHKTDKEWIHYISDDYNLRTFSTIDVDADDFEELPVRGGFHMEKQDLELAFGYCDRRPDADATFNADHTYGNNGAQGDATLQGAEYELYNRSTWDVKVGGKWYNPNQRIPNGSSQTYITDANSVIETANDYLPYGTYELVEVKPPEGYTALGRNLRFKFKIRDNGEVTNDKGERIEWLDKKIHDLATDPNSEAKDGKYACNDVVRFDIELVKVLQRSTEEANGSATVLAEYPAAGVQFEIRLKSTGKLYATITTDENGYATTADPNYPDGRLPYGVYTIHEVPDPRYPGMNFTVTDGVSGGLTTSGKFKGYTPSGDPVWEPFGKEDPQLNSNAVRLSVVGYDADGKETVIEEPVTIKGETDYTGDKWLCIDDFEIDGTYNGLSRKDLSMVPADGSNPDTDTAKNLKWGIRDKRWQLYEALMPSANQSDSLTVPFATSDTNGPKRTFRNTWYSGQEVITANNNRKVDPIVEEFIRIVKRDATTGEVIPLANTKFKLYKGGKPVGPYYDTRDNKWTIENPDGGHVIELANHKSSEYWYPDEQCWKTDANGIIYLPMRLRYGVYKIQEIEAPTGYILPSKTNKITTTVHSLSETGELSDDTQVGSVVVYEEYNDDQNDLFGEPKTPDERDSLTEKVDGATDPASTGVREDNTKLFAVTTRNDKATESVYNFYDVPAKGVYHITKYDKKTEKRIAGAVFEVYADEDIYTGDGVQRYSEGQLVDVITIGADGTGASMPLYFGHKEGNTFVPTGKFHAIEVKAPEGYTLDTQIHEFTFSYKDDETELIHIYEDINNTPTEFHLEKYVKSEDGANWSETETQAILDGVTFEIKRIGGDPQVRYNNGNVSTDTNANQVVDLVNGAQITTTNGGKIDIDYVGSGLYSIREVYVPNGYVLDTTVRYFNVDKDGYICECDESGTKIDGDSVVEDRSETCVSYKLKMTWRNIYTRWDFSKVDINGDKEIPGAHMEIHKGDADGPIAQFYDITGTIGTDAKWESTEETHRIDRLPLDWDDDGNQIPTDYTLVETISADGYVLATPMKFTLTVDGVVHYLKMRDKQLFVHKHDITDGSPEIPGAQLTVTDKETGDVVDSWTSGEDGTDESGNLLPHPVKNLEEGKFYTLTEVVAPDEYVKAESVDFFVTYVYEESQDGETDGTHNPYVKASLVNQDIIMKDKQVFISKKTVTGEDELPGAEITVYVDKDGEHGDVVDTWISTDKPHAITGLVEGGDYILYENTAPAGYVRASEIQFHVTGMLNELPEISEENPDWNDAEKENQLITMVDKVFYLTKTDITTSKEVEGATIEIKDEDGNIIETWVSDGTEHKIGGSDAEHQLEEGKTYTLTETKRAETKGGHVTEEKVDKESYDYNPRSYIRAGTYDEWADAKKDPTTTDTKFNHVEDSEGYTETITFTVTGADDEGIKVDQKINMKDDYTKVKISKKDITNGKYVKGAKLIIKDKDGNEVDSWITTDEDHYIKRLPIGTYTLTEIIEPGSEAWRQGYTTAETITFEVTETGIQQKVEMWDDITTVKITKSDITDSKPVVGAKLTIKAKGEDKPYVTSTGEVCEWITTDQPHYIERLPFGKYTLTETMTPEVNKLGYVTAETVEFEVLDLGSHEGTNSNNSYQTSNELDLTKLEKDKDGKPVIPYKVAIQKCDMKDDFTKLKITKTDIANSKLIDGAELVIKTEDGVEKARWITDTVHEPDGHYIERLPIGKYTLTEIMTPEVNKQGYVTAETIHFEIKDTPEIQKCDMKDDFTKLQISKVDITNGKELPGATLVIKDANKNVVAKWVSTDKPHYIERLPMGDYTLTEITAPKGYKKAETIKFTIKDTPEIQKVKMKDKHKGKSTSTSKSSSDSKITQTGESTLPFVIAFIGIIVALAVLLLLRKKKAIK